MPVLTFQVLAVVWLGAFLGALAAGGAGFAFALAASAIWLHVLDPLHTTGFVVASGTLLHVGFVWSMRASIEPARLWPFLAGGLVGIPLGVHLLAHSNSGALKTMLGLFLAGYGFYALTVRRLPYVGAGGRGADAIVGFVGGILGGLGGYSGVLPTIWTQLRGWSKETARSVYQPYILVAQIMTLVLVGALAFDRSSTALFATMLPPLVAGAWVGWRIYGRLDDRRFRQVIAALLIVSGITIVI
jgi:uncharacterized protein